MDFDIEGVGKSFVEEFKSFLKQRKEKNATVKKTLPIRPEWEKKLKEMDEIANQVINQTKRIDALRKSLWSEIELTLNDFSDMRYNQKTREIEILEYPEEKDMVPSPYLSRR